MTTSDEKIAEVGKNISEKAALIWSVADTLVGPFKPHEYGLVSLTSLYWCVFLKT